jgi:hypothetical protein
LLREQGYGEPLKLPLPKPQLELPDPEPLEPADESSDDERVRPAASLKNAVRAIIENQLIDIR